MKLYIGKVKDPNTRDLGSIVGCSIPDLYNDTSNLIYAVPLNELMRFPQMNDDIVILKPNDDMDLYYYIQTHTDDTKISLEFNDSYIKIDKEGNINIKSTKDLTIDSNNINMSCNKFSLKCSGMEKMSADAGSLSLPATVGVRLDPAPSGMGFVLGASVESAPTPIIPGSGLVVS